MARFDRYLLSQLFLLFGFFSLILVAVFWVNTAVRLFDRLIDDGQSAGIVLQFILLSLPRVIAKILPFAAFASAAYVTYRLSGESELVILQAGGVSPWRLARPVFAFGMAIAAMTGVIVMVLLPLARQELSERQRALTHDVTTRLLSEGTFLHPTKGVTFFIRKIDPDGTLHDVFLSDRRNSAHAETYTAGRAFLINTSEGDGPARPRLIMLDGLGQSLNTRTGRLITTRFDDLSYDLTRLIDAIAPMDIRAEYLVSPRILRAPAAVARQTNEHLGVVLEEAHGRLRDVGLGVVIAMLGFAALLGNGYSRAGVWRSVGLGVVILIAIKMVENLTTGMVRADPAVWPLVYAPLVMGAGCVALLLSAHGRQGVGLKGRSPGCADRTRPA